MFYKNSYFVNHLVINRRDCWTAPLDSLNLCKKVNSHASASGLCFIDCVNGANVDALNGAHLLKRRQEDCLEVGKRCRVSDDCCSEKCRGGFCQP